jgi:hypothetical protein
VEFVADPPPGATSNPSSFENSGGASSLDVPSLLLSVDVLGLIAALPNDISRYAVTDLSGGPSPDRFDGSDETQRSSSRTSMMVDLPSPRAISFPARIASKILVREKPVLSAASSGVSEMRGTCGVVW